MEKQIAREHFAFPRQQKRFPREHFTFARQQKRFGISLNLVSAFFGFLFPQRFVMDRRRRRCGNCGKAGAFFAEAYPSSLWKSESVAAHSFFLE